MFLHQYSTKIRSKQCCRTYKGKSAIWIARLFRRKRNFYGENLWEREYFVTTVGLNEKIVRNYIKNQKKKEENLDQREINFDNDNDTKK